MIIARKTSMIKLLKCCEALLSTGVCCPETTFDHSFTTFRILRPLPHIPLMATGGVNPDNIPRPLSTGIDVVGTGVTVLKKDCIDQDNYETVQYLAKMHKELVVRWQKENEK